MLVEWQSILAVVQSGHQVASGKNGNPRFPGGTLAMQSGHFLDRGLDISRFFGGTLNVNILPASIRPIAPKFTFRDVKWHPTEPAEDFSFFDVRLIKPGMNLVSGLIYYPHPETKPAHFQPPGLLELLLPFVEGLSYGDRVAIEIPRDQMGIEFSED